MNTRIVNEPGIVLDGDTASAELLARRKRLGDPQRLLDIYANGWSDGRARRGSQPGSLPSQERHWYENGYRDGEQFEGVGQK